MAALLMIVLIALVALRPSGLPVGRKGAKFSEVVSKNRNINWLSFARLFLFGARDVWFVVGIPIYFYSVLSDGSELGNRGAFFAIGSFMAVWTILYGFVQAWAPRILKAKTRSERELLGQARVWAAMLVVIPVVLAVAVFLSGGASHGLTVAIVLGLLLFGAVFAVNSSLHSYLILSLADARRVTLDVGFYYMANAAGRLTGTVLSGLTYQIGGLPLCLATAAAMVFISFWGIGRMEIPAKTHGLT